MLSWLTKGRTALLQKDKSKGNISSNYRAIMCLPLMWKLLSGVYNCRLDLWIFRSTEVVTRRTERITKRSGGTNYLLKVDRVVIGELKSRKII